MTFTRGRSQATLGMFAMYSLPCIYLAPTFLLIQQTNKDNKEGHDNIRYQHLSLAPDPKNGSGKLARVKLCNHNT